MERSISVRTPESIAFYYELAGLGSRFLAVGVDLLIQVVIFIVFSILAALAADRVMSLASAVHLSGKPLASTVIAVTAVFVFLDFYGYFIAFEKYWNGQTPGKRLLGIRVVRDGGYPVELAGAIIRNLIRIVEMLFGGYVLSAISMLLSSENKRLGDYAAGTIVVRDRGFEVRDPKSWLRPGAGDVDARSNRLIANLTADELALVDKYVGRRTSFDAQSARATAARIAGALRPRLDPEFAALPDEELLLKIATRHE